MAYQGPIYSFDRHPSHAPLTEHDINIGHRIAAAFGQPAQVAHRLPMPLPLPNPRAALANYPTSGRMYFSAPPPPGEPLTPTHPGVTPAIDQITAALQQQMQIQALLAALQHAFTGFGRAQ